MYEMYPQQWGSEAASATPNGTDTPRRRARRIHSVAPRVIRVAKQR